MRVNLTLGGDLGVLGLINAKPEFNIPPEEDKYTLAYGEGWQIDLGEIFDADNDTVSVNLTCTNNNNTFLNLVNDGTGFYSLIIDQGNTTESEVGTYDFELVVSDPVDNKTYPFRMKITTPE